MRLIDADVAIKNLKEWLNQTGIIPKDTSYYWELLGCIEDAPTVDVKPVIHAHWVDANDFVNIGNGIHTECSHCHTWSKDKTNYCRFCGAIMDEKEGSRD